MKNRPEFVCYIPELDVLCTVKFEGTEDLIRVKCAKEHTLLIKDYIVADLDNGLICIGEL